jgi:hypothetical protein
LEGDDESVGSHPLDSGSAGGCSTVEALKNVDVHDLDKTSVTAVPDDADDPCLSADLIYRF